MTKTRLLAPLLFVLALAGCGGGGSSGTGSGAGNGQTLAALIAYDALSAPLFTPARLVPRISGLNGMLPRCSVTSGALPPGVALAADCSLGGTPTQPGTYSATVTLTLDGVTGSASASASVVVTAPALQAVRDAAAGSTDRQLRLLAPVSGLPVVALAIGATLYAPQAGDVLAYTVAAGALPAGVVLNPADGTISGTPSAWGTSTVSIGLAITHGGQTFNTAPLQVTIGVVEGPFTLTYFDCCVTAFVGNAVDMHPSSTHVPVPGATTRFTVDATSAPQGLTLDPLTGIYSGNLAAAGNPLAVVITQTVTYPDGSTASARWSSQAWNVAAVTPAQLQYMQQEGTFGEGMLSLSILASQYNGTVPAQIAGQINMAGFIGPFGVNIGAPVAHDHEQPAGRCQRQALREHHAHEPAVHVHRSRQRHPQRRHHAHRERQHRRRPRASRLHGDFGSDGRHPGLQRHQPAASRRRCFSPAAIRRSGISDDGGQAHKPYSERVAFHGNFRASTRAGQISAQLYMAQTGARIAMPIDSAKIKTIASVMRDSRRRSSGCHRRCSHGG